MQRLQQPEPAPDTVTYRPAGGEIVSTTPPAFVWLPEADAEQYEIEVAPDAGFAVVALRQQTPFNFHRPDRVLEPGRWYWRYRARCAHGWSDVSAARDFTVPAGAASFTVPDPTELAHRVPSAHPRVLFRPGDFDRLRSHRGHPHVKPLIDAAVSLAEDHLGAAIPPEPEWDRAVGSFNPRHGLNETTAQQGTEYKQFYSALASGMTRNALAYRLTGDTRFRDEARRWLRHVSGLDPAGFTSYWFFHTAWAVAVGLAQALDWLWDDLDEAERAAAVASAAARGRELFHDAFAEAFLRPGASHPMNYGLISILTTGLALHGHDPEAERWLLAGVQFLGALWPPFGGDDGGWAEGFGYGRALRTEFQVAYVGTGVNAYELPWTKNVVNLFRYFTTPGGSGGSFGDSSSTRADMHVKRWLERLAAVYQDADAAWSAAAIPDPFPPAMDSAARLSDFLYWGEVPAPRRPDAAVPAMHLRDVGWVAMHSHLGDREGDVALHFKSSPWGSYSHSHADQNSFILEAFGEPLFVDSGIYPWYGSAHDYSWSKQSRAHNLILVNGKGQGAGQKAASGEIVDFTTGPAFDYVLGDATRAYQVPSSQRIRERLGKLRFELADAADDGLVEKARRHVVFARPNVVLLLDDVETRAPAFVEWLLHAPTELALDAQRGTILAANGAARALVHLLAPGGMTLSQSDRFTAAPERGVPADWKQWHLTATPPSPAARTLILAAIVVYRDGEEAHLPPVEPVESSGALGARVGDLVVLFKTDADRPTVIGGGIRTDGAVAVARLREGQIVQALVRGGTHVEPA